MSKVLLPTLIYVFMYYRPIFFKGITFDIKYSDSMEEGSRMEASCTDCKKWP